MPASTKRLSIPLLYKEQGFCFWVGFLSAGTFEALLLFLLDTGLAFLGMAEHLWQDVATTFISYGLTAGGLSFVLGYLTRKLHASADSWRWLSFLIPTFALTVAGIQVEIENGLESHLPGDAFYALMLYAGAALCYGVIAFVIRGGCEWFDRRTPRHAPELASP